MRPPTPAPRKAATRKPVVVPREHQFQARLTTVLALELAPPGHLSRHGVCWFAIDHANFAGVAPGARIGKGIIAGLSDLMFLYRGNAYVIELKRPDGVLSEAQKKLLPVIRMAGVQVAVCCTDEQVLRTLDTWEIPRGRRVIFPLPKGD